MSAMSGASGKKGKAEFTRTFRGLALLLVITVVVPVVVVSNQTRLLADDLRGRSPILGQNQLAVVRAPSGAPTIQWTYSLAGASVWGPPVIADLRGDGELEVVFGSYDNKTYCLDARTGKLLWSFATGGQIWYSPAVADLFRDGKKEVIVGSFDSIVYCLNGTTGSVMWSYKTGSGPGNPVLSTPIVADLFGDGKQEVITISGGVYCLEGTTGRLLWSCKTAGWVEYSPIIADVLGDSKEEVIVGSDNHHVYCLSGATGQILWSFTTGGMISNHPTVADLNADGNMEVVAGSYDNRTYCLDGRTGGLLWNYTTQSVIKSSPLSADLFGDGKKEIVLVAPDPLPPISPSNRVYCLNGTTGQVLWIYHTGYMIFSNPVAADLLADGKEEVVVVSDPVSCLDGNGATKWGYTSSSNSGTTPLIVDLYGNGKREVVIGDNGVYCLGGENGSIIWSLPKGESVEVTPVAADLDGDGVQELIAVSFGIGFTDVYCMSYTNPLPPYTHLPPGITRLEVSTTSNGISLSGVLVESIDQPLGQPKLSGRTDSWGNVLFVSIFAGNYTIRCSKTGYENITTTAEITANTTAQWYIDLHVSSQPFGGSLSAWAFPILIGFSVTLSLIALLVIGRTVRNNSRRISISRWPASLGECAICKLDLLKMDEIVRCPYCGIMAHKAHMLEWIHVKGYCPSCHQHLNEEGLKNDPALLG